MRGKTSSLRPAAWQTLKATIEVQDLRHKASARLRAQLAVVPERNSGDGGTVPDRKGEPTDTIEATALALYRLGTQTNPIPFG
jgi:hypothetical protein